MEFQSNPKRRCHYLVFVWRWRESWSVLLSTANRREAHSISFRARETSRRAMVSILICLPKKPNAALERLFAQAT